ncbi:MULTISPECIES: biotin transporter BioY [Mesorhizobium]|uniref:Biotin transporter n=1 Tax=Mesorhizobium denitrificans TaxID=2294114 RepID=A0A371XHW0_9HYPH|nr:MULTISPECIES: biotin transporter BioY [Mesorhizobium]RFC68815.1 biotin transporter BioY [Mesorhizobium denitrificans]
MSAAATQSSSLVSLALPKNNVTRLVSQILLALAGSALLALSAKTKVVLGPVDLSLQSLVVLLIGAAYGWRLGVATVLLYLAEGAYGLPVFQGTPEKGIGLAYMVGPTGGYLAGFVVMAAIAGWAADRGLDRNPVKFFGALLTGEVIMMAMGFAWLAVLIGVDKSWQFGVAPFIVPDLIKVALAACLVPAVWQVIARFRGNV